MTKTPDIDVLIAGAGPVGLATAIELGRRGISCRVVERNDRVGYSPRAKTTNARTREHLRRWGIADALRDASPFSRDHPPSIVFATRMNGPLLARFDDAFNAGLEPNNLYSEPAQWVPQYILEDVLRAHAVSLPCVTISFDTELVDFTPADDGVAVNLNDLRSGAPSIVRCRYLVGADGARSRVREKIGAVLVGEDTAFKNYNIVFRSQALAAANRHGRALMYWLVNDDAPSILGPLDESGLYFFIATKLPTGRDPADLDAADLIRLGTGLADLDVEILRADPWTALRLVADKYAEGRVFLAGDACHLHPPFGGFGMNMGIGDGVDLGWKLAATLQGWGGPDLLASYQPERRPVHERIIEEAMINYASLGNQLVQPMLEDPGPVGAATRREVGDMILATKLREFKTLGVVLGTRYENSPINAREAGSPPPEHFMLYVPSAYPGCLAPHLWLADGSSLYDHFGDGFTLLVSEGSAAEAGSMQAAAATCGIPLKLLCPGDSRLRARYEARFALIRPDQHVAWRGDTLPADALALLCHVTGGLSTSKTADAA